MRHGPNCLSQPAHRPRSQAGQRVGSGLGCGRARSYSLRCTRTVGTVPAPDAPRRWADCTIPSYRRCPADEEPPTSRRYLASTPETPRSGDPEGFCLTFGGPPKENGKNSPPDFSRTRICCPTQLCAAVFRSGLSSVPRTRKPNPTPPTPPSKPRPLPPTPNCSNAARPSSRPAQTSPAPMPSACTASPSSANPTAPPPASRSLPTDSLQACSLLPCAPPTPALLRTITSQRHPTVLSYLHTVRHDLGYKNAQPTLADILMPTPSPAVPATSSVPTPTRHSPPPSTTSNTPSPNSDTPLIRQASTYTSQR